MSKFHLKPVFRVCSFSWRLLLVYNQPGNRVFLVSCVDFLKTKLTIFLSELRVDHRFILLGMNIFLFQLEFSSDESTEAFTESTNPANSFSCRQKSPIISTPDHSLNFPLKRAAYKNHN